MTHAIDAPPATRRRTLLLDDADHIRDASDLLARGRIVAHGFANFYAITARGDAATVRRVNVMKGRPADQVGSLTLPSRRAATVFAWDALPAGLSRDLVESLFEALFRLGPFGFRGPAADHVPDHMTSIDDGVRTTQIIAPGYACPSNGFLEAAADRVGPDLLYITSANRSRRATGAPEEPAHWRARPLRRDFEDAGLVMLAHRDEAAARRRYPHHLPMSTSILGFHRVVRVDGRPALVLERHGSLHADRVRQVLDGFGWGMHVADRARTRLPLRRYEPGGPAAPGPGAGTNASGRHEGFDGS